MKLSRRQFLAVSIAALAGSALSRYLDSRDRLNGMLLSAYEDERGQQFIGGLHLRDARLFGAPIPTRAHGCAVDPNDPQRVFFFARRPGVQAFELRLDAGGVRSVFSTPAGRHLAGHGLFTRDGRWLYTPEHDYEHACGVIAVRDTRDFRIIEEFDSGGLDPHEIAWLGEDLLVANGGIMTHPSSYRRKLNIPTMDPSLCRLDARSGKCLEQRRLPDHLLSIRHLSVVGNDYAVAGLQYEGDPQQAPGLVAAYRKEQGFHLLPTPADALRRSNGYVASVSADTQCNRILAACPRGAGVAAWRLDTGEFIDVIEAVEAYGLSHTKEGVPLVSQRDGTALSVAHDMAIVLAQSNRIRWDDHWRFHEDAVTVTA
jgi:hypothetical protein